MKEGTIILGRFFGIPLKLHWSFALLLFYVAYNVYDQNSFVFMGYVFFLFFCVVLHEYGHALMAKHYSIETKDIILSPIGGVARLKNLPEKPGQELAIAFAGPLVNLLLCILIGLYLFLVLHTSLFIPPDLNFINTTPDYIRLAFTANLVLFLFNLIPAFPMDGGRVLRALLAIKLGRARATNIASIIGRIIAVCFIVYGLMVEDYLFALLGIFVFSMAGAESREVLTTEKLANAQVQDCMRINFTKLHIGDTMEMAYELLIRNGETNFLVFDSLGYVSGTLPAQFIIAASDQNRLTDSCSQWMSTINLYILSTATLKEAFELMNKNGSAILTVKDTNEIVLGVIDRESISRAILYIKEQK